MDIRKLSLKQLEPNRGQMEGLPPNPRKWTAASLEYLLRSMTETPELVECRGLIVYPLGKKYIILGGNMRYTAAKLGLSRGDSQWESIWCIILPESTSIEKRIEIAMKDNGTFGEFDFTILPQWGNFDFKSWGIQIPEMQMGDKKREAEDDHYDAEAKAASIHTPKSQPGDIYKLGSHRLMCGDSTREMDLKILMGGVLGDLTVTDPPYNVAYEGASGLTIENDNMSSAAFKDFLTKSFRGLASVLIAGAGAYVFYASREVVNFVEAFKAAGFEYKQNLVWVKNTITLGRQDYQWMHEPCLYGWKSGGPHYFIDDRTQRTVQDDTPDFEKMSRNELREFCIKTFGEGGVKGDVVRENKPLRNADHPTMKPIPLIGRFVQNSSRPGGVVVDPFGGSGSTLMACEQLGRRCYTMEYDPKYVDVIIDRWEAFTGEKAVKL